MKGYFDFFLLGKGITRRKLEDSLWYLEISLLSQTNVYFAVPEKK